MSREEIKGLSFVGLFVGVVALYFGFVSASTCALPGEAAYYATCPSFQAIATDLLPPVGIIVLSIAGLVFSSRKPRTTQSGTP